ncbi:nitric oxide reductase activation protein NorD [Pseudidiomarina sp.]|uniref:nitric oxide reductase activation protein NorD n=1 Tax=Pseudidiomarina sp. TaxID=2081707 RepID=UPI00299EE1F6|nr:VWA domain-containing protein [Pseudidiomarina sp.]MDX1706507.1 VWA domain-containing protein [Pseudidiomarina sp.]
MAEAEEVVSDLVRHASVYIRRFWQRHRRPPGSPPRLYLTDIAARLDLFIHAAVGTSYPIRPTQYPARATMLGILFRHDKKPRQQIKIPATNDTSIWLPPEADGTDHAAGTDLFRVMALQQVVRARRGSAASYHQIVSSPLLADVYLLIEAWSADHQLIDLLPGMKGHLNQLRLHCLNKRPPLNQFSRVRQPLEQFARKLLTLDYRTGSAEIAVTTTPAQSLAYARKIIHSGALLPPTISAKKLGPRPLVRDWWTGDYRVPADEISIAVSSAAAEDDQQTSEVPRGARLNRRPEERDAVEDEDDSQPEDGIWMVQGDEPHQHAEDPLGLQRPTDRDDETSAEEFGDMVSELSEARLVATPGQPKEVLLSDDPPDAKARQQLKAAIAEGKGILYPEWDYRNSCYNESGATVRLLSPQHGSQQWVDDTRREHESMLNTIRKRFEMLQARRVRHRRQQDGDEIDLDAYIESYTDFRAGKSMSDALYQVQRTADRNLAITLLIDISGSTDSWISENRRIIDVEREALLLVCIALEGLGEPYSVQAFSGEGPHAVTVQQIKGFEESFSNDIALRISSLEPQYYTRAGAAIRHATADLMKQPAAHRLLLVLSDGKPSDKDDYEGRYGVEDMRQAVTEARLQGISPFCLTIDRQAANYLPRIFGTHQYAMLTKPERLSTVLLEWMKHLVTV